MPSLEIHFGSVFKVRDFPGRLDVITDIGENTWVFASKIIRNDDGTEYLSWVGGTAGLENIEEIVGRWTPEKVLAALREGYLKSGFHEDKITHLLNLTKQASARTHRTIL